MFDSNPTFTKPMAEQMSSSKCQPQSAHFEPGTHRLRIAEVRVDPVCAFKIPAALSQRRKILAFAQLNGMVQVAYEDGENHAMVLELAERLLKLPVQLWPVDREELSQAIQRILGNSHGGGMAAKQMAVQDATSIGDDLIHAAYLRQASDVHIDPGSR